MTSMSDVPLINMPQSCVFAFLACHNPDGLGDRSLTTLGVTVGMNTESRRCHPGANARSFRTFEFFALAAVHLYVIAKIVTLCRPIAARRLVPLLREVSMFETLSPGVISSSWPRVPA